MASFLGRVMRHPFSAKNEAMVRLAEHPKTRDFVRSLDYADLPENWANDREIVRLANDAYQQVGIDSPFFQAWNRGSKLVDENGIPIVFYHGSQTKGLRSIDPDVSASMPEGMGSAFIVRHPGTSLAYAGRPGPQLQDAGYQNLRNAVAGVISEGGSIAVPDIRPGVPQGTQRYYRLTRAEYEDPKMRERLARSRMSDALDDIREIDWRLNLGRLSKSYNDALAGYPVPKGALESAVSGHLAHQLFLRQNADDLAGRGIWPKSIFSEPALGEIYPVYANVRNPFVVESVPGARDWTQTADMRIDTSFLTPDEKAKLDKIGMASGRDYYTPGQLFPSLNESSLPTDDLSGILRFEGDHDGLLSRNVRDGGGARVPLTDVAAVHRAEQLKSTRNIGLFNPWSKDMYRVLLPYAASGGALAAAMGAPSSAFASVLPEGWVPPSAKAELQGMEPPVWLDPVELLSSFASAGGSTAFRAGQTALDAAQGWLADKIPPLPEVPEEHYEAAQ